MKKRLRDVALKEEVNYVSSDAGPTATLLGITNSLSSELTVQILNHLFKKLNELCLVQGGKFDEREHVRRQDDERTLEILFAFPTLLPCSQSNKVKDTLQPAVIIQESLAVYIREQTCPVILSGDLLQQFLIVTFNKLDRGDIWDDEFELNTMLQILSFKLNVGHFPHLADLVTRINYNYFYMSDSGNLQTVPSFGTAAKLGKFSAFRGE
ncbi:hypothetical protein BHM03_00020146 [Ensete ventricosum]|nr:hypothetical protein BHM03_00020146 [Ensete ventricosum]